MKRVLIALLLVGLTIGIVYAAWDSSTDMQALTVSAAVAQIQNDLQAIDGSEATGPAKLTCTTNIGIGTTAPMGLFEAKSGTSSRLVILGNGNVGIGNTGPAYNLYVAGSLGIGGTATFSNLITDGNLAAITTASKVNTSSLTGSTYLPDDTVDTTALKTAESEVSWGDGAPYYATFVARDTNYATYATKVSISRNDFSTYSHLDVTGGQYCFWPQTKSASNVGYCKFLYVTASGTDLWYYILADKNTGEIRSVSVAEDAPFYGNNTNMENLPHPFGNYDKDKYEVILLDKETTQAIKQESKDMEISPATLINTEYKPDMKKTQQYQPLHSGKYKRKSENGQEVVTMQMVETIPDYIKVRSLLKLTDEEKENKRLIQEAQKIVNQEEKETEDLIQKKIKEQAIAALQAEGKLTVGGKIVK